MQKQPKNTLCNILSILCSYRERNEKNKEKQNWKMYL